MDSEDVSDSGGAPRLTVVVATDRLATIADLLDRLERQTVASDIEVVVVRPPSDGHEEVPEDAGALGALRVTRGDLLPLGEARAVGMRGARGAVVVVAETHAFPEPAWAERLLGAFGAGWTAVMPAVANANPETALSWSSFLVDYGEWAFDGSREITSPPQYHSAFDREAMLSFGPRLGTLLEPGSTLGAELRARGRRSYHEPSARILHLNVATPRAWVHERFLGGRLLGSARRARWRRSRSILYLLASPLVPVIRLWRTRRAMAAASRAGVLPRWSIGATVLGCVVWGVGEAVGYAVGSGRASAAAMLEYEIHKARYLGPTPGGLSR